MRLPGDRHRLLLHGLQQGGLRLGWGAVDFVGQDDVREHGSPHELEDAASGGVILFEQLGAGNVARHEVRRELHTRKGEVEGFRNGLHEQRLGEAWYADDDHVTTGENGRHEVLHDLLLADNFAPDLLKECFTSDTELLEQLKIALLVARARLVVGPHAVP